MDHNDDTFWGRTSPTASEMMESINKIMREIDRAVAIPGPLLASLSHPPLTATELGMMLPKTPPIILYHTPRGSNIFGLRVISSTYAAVREQYRFPRSKKKRIHKKWRKDPLNYWNAPRVHMFGNNIVGHPEIIQRMKDWIDRQDEAYDMKWR